ncbi:uncharacterized protein N7479_004561 [Penicillium vulpinum]|uniref:Peptidase A2 domain-containing protein n=1 Tax=Penicillium vulpinum TaxID=29845 RepID=A0A1V6RS75_9EURO|nr:uncharacterized protein N7479_004561 [Penicillium vulpinum]KAJ5964685.1 hypothetical protein N7479_004561 [Penicillium vulpinum]OQE04344.1 hypothetical protein PENVUL_c034G01607 [Penicillium vulpinum]
MHSLVKLLLAHRANPLPEEPPGISVLPLVNGYKPTSKYEEPFPLLYVVASGRLNTVEPLFNHGAEPKGIGRWRSKRNGIDDVCFSFEICDLPCIRWTLAYPEIFRLLLDRGADISLPATKVIIKFDRVPATGGIISTRHEFECPGRAPTSTIVLQKALKSGHTETVQIILEKWILLQTPDRDSSWD